MKGFCQSQILINLSNSPGKIIPGGHFTLFFDVKSSSEIPEQLEDQLILPDKWTLLSSRKPERISGQKEIRYFFVIGTSTESGAGKFPLQFKLNSSGLQSSSTVLIEIQELHKIDVFILSQPEFVKEGDTLKVEYLIQNSGNSKEKLALKTERGIVEGVKDSLVLEANSRIKVKVSQKIPFTESNSWQITSDLSGHIKGFQFPIYQATSIPVFSSQIKKIDPYFRFPLEIGGGYLSYQYGDRRMTAFQYSASGRGFIDQKSKNYIDFLVRGPNQFVFPAIGSYDQYSLNYQYKKNTSITVGDYTLQLNNLMEFGRFGRGVRLEQDFRKISYTVFYQRTRFFFNQKGSFGGKFILKIKDRSNIAVNLDSKDVIHRNQRFWSNLMGISSLIRTNNVTVESELVAGKANGIIDYGAFLRFHMLSKWVTISGNFIYAGKNFYGYYNNSILINNNISFNLSRKLSLGVGTNFSNINPSLDINFYSVSPKDKNYMAFVSYQMNVKNRIYLSYLMLEREDRQKPSQFHYSENLINVSYSYNSERFSFFYQGRYGKSRNLLISDTLGKNESYSNVIQPLVRISPSLWIGGYLEHQHTSKFSKADVIENLYFYGGNVRLDVRRNLYANVSYRNNYAPDELYVRRSFMDASLLLELKRHKVTLTGGRSFIPNIPNSNQNTLFFTLKYALKLNISLGKKRNIGSIRGKLTGEGFSKQGNLIQLGSHKFLTDSTGIFSFDGLAPDKYYLSIAQNDSKNDGVVPVLKMPMFVDVKADSSQVIEIPLTKTGSITGKVEFLKTSQKGMSAGLSEQPSVLIKLTNEFESFLTELNGKNEFSFKEMKPGNWTLSAFIPGSQDRFLIDESQKELEIEKDRTMNVIFKIRPNEKRIHFSGKSFDLTIKK